MKTAIDWLVEQICVDVDMYDDDGNIDRTEFWNAFRGSVDLSDYIKKAKEMEKEQSIEFARNCLNKAKDLDCLTAFVNVKQYYNETFD